MLDGRFPTALSVYSLVGQASLLSQLCARLLLGPVYVKDLVECGGDPCGPRRKGLGKASESMTAKPATGE